MADTITCWRLQQQRGSPLSEIIYGATDSEIPFAHQVLTIELIDTLNGSTRLSAAPVIEHDILGRPRLDIKGLAVSYSYCQGLLYGAVANVCSLGIDACCADDFRGSYPFGRVFHPDEHARCTEVAGNRNLAAALLWACKEAVVKSMGTGFRKLSPLDLQLDQIRRENGLFVADMTGSLNGQAVVQKRGKHWIALSGSKKEKHAA